MRHSTIPHQRIFARPVGLAVACVLCLVNAGCVIPVPHPRVACEPRPGLFDRSDADFIHPAQTTREQVLLTIGEPDFAWDGGRAFAYVWGTSNLEIILASVCGRGSASATSFTVRDKHRLYVRFDNAGIVQECRWLDQPLSEFRLQEGRTQ